MYIQHATKRNARPPRRCSSAKASTSNTRTAPEGSARSRSSALGRLPPLRLQRGVGASARGARRRPQTPGLCGAVRAAAGLKAHHPWLCEPAAQALQQALKDLCKAWDAKYTVTKSGGFGAPRFKKRGEGDTLRLPQDCRYGAARGVVHLPKLGPLRLRHSRVAAGELKNVTLRQVRGRWVAALQTERAVEVGVAGAAAAVGLDFGAATTIMPSVGAPIEL